MRILFLGVTPSPELSKKLSDNQFIAETNPTKAYSQSWDIVFIRFSENTKDFTHQLKLAAHENTYVSVVIPAASMANPELAQFLLDFERKNEVIALEMLEALFWFSIQNALQFFKNSKTLSELETLKKQVESVTEELESNLNLAKAIQRSLLPEPPKLSIPDVHINFKFIPSSGKGGDYFDVFEFGDKKRFGLLLSESESHTITANLLSILLKVKLHEFKDRFVSAESFMSFLNKEFSGQIPPHTPLNFFFAIFERTSLRFQFVNGGEYAPILLRNKKATTVTSKFQEKLGFNEGDYLSETLSLAPGDKLLLHSSGLLKFLKSSEVTSLFESLSDLPSAEIISEINLALREKGADGAKRDITLIYFEVSEKALFLK